VNVSYELIAKMQCGTCHGEGRINESATPCPSCHGKGVIERRVSLQEALAAVLVPPAVRG
jgi:DnaJ-class molecular chaperone